MHDRRGSRLTPAGQPSAPCLTRARFPSPHVDVPHCGAGGGPVLARSAIAAGPVRLAGPRRIAGHGRGPAYVRGVARPRRGSTPTGPVGVERALATITAS